ncbi:hypothetical protein ILT44_15215 [Microvirga sp. BT689]|uniref:hypothetical protein n=1 Tax=Microvirga arvi TaxID=2778731 RepID=UPI00194F4BBD|nr:hypothetical protein [Microvirga arvi]MBM6581544.1 hypothetical protein [Microvirga arvi]
MTDPQPSPGSNHADGLASLTWYPPPAGRWQNFPLLTPENSTGAVASNEANALAFQVAFEREKDRADAAQLLITDLKEQLTSLKEEHGEKQEEVIVLREELAEAKTGTLQIIGQQRATIKEDKRANSALPSETASYEELNSLRASASAAWKVADSERKKAAAAFEQLEVVQGQLTVLAALEWSRKEVKSQLRSREDQVIAAPLLESREELPPVTRTFQLPQTLEVDRAPSKRPEIDLKRESQRGKGQVATHGNTRPVSAQREAKALTRDDGKATIAASRSRRVQSEAESSRLTRLTLETRGQNVRIVERAPPRISPRPRILTQSVDNSRNPAALSLPSALRPDSRLW